jgi:uncharacterized protein
MIFVDTSAWFASVAPTDANHSTAIRWFNQNKSPLVTSDYVVDETLTLLRARRQPRSALALGDAFFDGTLTKIHHLSAAEFRGSWQIFRQFSDKNWSFTDCTSKLLLEKLRIQQVVAFDNHFYQFGSIVLLP